MTVQLEAERKETTALRIQLEDLVGVAKKLEMEKAASLRKDAVVKALREEKEKVAGQWAAAKEEWTASKEYVLHLHIPSHYYVSAYIFHAAVDC